jgi:serine/threonine-protein kinase
MMGAVYTRKGSFEEAIAHCEKGLSLGGSAPALALLGYVYGASGAQAKARTIIEQLEKQREQGYAVAYQIATVHAGLGERDSALEWLEKAYEEHNGGLTGLKVDAAFDDLRSDPRFQNLLSGVGLGNG